MYYPKIYSGKTEEQIIESMQEEGYKPVKFNHPADYMDNLHRDPKMKLLAFLHGSMALRVEDEILECTQGDKAVIPCNMIHAGRVGKYGCTFLLAEKKM